MESNKAKELLTQQVKAIVKLDGNEQSSPEFRKWKRDTEIVIEKIFGKSSRHIRDFGEISYWAGVYFQGMPDDADVKACRDGLNEARAILQSMIEEIDQFGLETSTSDASNQKPTGAAQASKLIFISHSSVDKDIADALVDMLCTALNLRVADFLCTSVDGAKLRGGDETDTVLRREIRTAPAFLSILTPKAIASTYVLFELGARWGTEKPHIPLLAKGAGAEVLKEPLKATNALRLDHEPDVLQLVDDVAKALRRTPETPQSYHQKMGNVVRISRADATPEKSGRYSDLKRQNEIPASPGPLVAQHESNQIALSETAKKLLIEASGSVDGNVSKVHSSSYGDIVNVHTQNQGFLGKVEDNRNRAQWVDAFNELVRVGCFEQTSHDGHYRITHLAYQLADFLKQQGSG